MVRAARPKIRRALRQALRTDHVFTWPVPSRRLSRTDVHGPCRSSTGYLIEILPQGPMITKPIDCDGVAVDGGAGYKDNSK